jgi:Na+-transporting NADH:ubiquinone oxidoreductase subunit NqrC
MNKIGEIKDGIRIALKKNYKATDLAGVSHDLLLSNVTRVNRNFKNNSQWYRNVHAKLIKVNRDLIKRVFNKRICAENYIGIVCENKSKISDNEIVKIKNLHGIMYLEDWKQIQRNVNESYANDFFKINSIDTQVHDKFNSYIEYQLISLQTGRYINVFGDQLEIVPSDSKELKMLKKIELTEKLQNENRSHKIQMGFVKKSKEAIKKIELELKNL